MRDRFNIVLAGVGGQGTLLAAEILGTAAVKDELNVRVSEIHGMAQRGGAVTSNVRIGKEVTSPTVMDGEANVLVGFEPIETLRNLRVVSKKTLVIMSDEKVCPPVLTAKKLAYPSMKSIVEKVKLFTSSIVIVETEKLAKEAGNILTRNAILVGVLAGTGKTPIRNESLVKALRELVPTKHMEANLRAFRIGCAYAKGIIKNL